MLPTEAQSERAIYVTPELVELAAGRADSKIPYAFEETPSAAIGTAS